MLKALDDFCHFIAEAPTAYHAAIELADRLASVGFSPLDWKESWELKSGEGYFVEKNGSLIAFRMPKKNPLKAHITLTHTDSPGFKVKTRGLSHKEGMSFLSTEIYGSPILDSWLNRDLAIAGRIFGEGQNGEIEEQLFFFDESPVIIPAAAAHIGDPNGQRSKQKEFQALISLGNSASLESVIAKTHTFKRILSYDLFLASIETPRYLGEHGELLASPRLDNLYSAYAAAVALMNSEIQSETLQIALFFNHEEIGSRSNSGAFAPLFDTLMQRIGHCQKLDQEHLLRLKAHSFCLSVDVAHAYLPSFSDRYDPQHHCLLGKGPVIKEHAAQKYASDAYGKARIALDAEKAGVPLQYFVSHSDVACGSTVGPIFAAQTGIDTIDLGAPILSMHAAREVLAPADLLHLSQLLKEFYHHG